MGHVLHDERRSASDEHAYQSACDADEDGFDEELGQDVDAPCADRHAQADFAGALGDGDVHDVHDADAAHHERDARYAGQQRGHQVGGAVQHRAEFLLRADGEVVLVIGLELVVAPEDGRYFVRGIVRHVLAEGGGEDALQVGLGQQALHHRGVGGKDDVVLVLAHGVVPLGLEDAHHAEGHLVEADDLAQRVLPVGEEVVDDGLSDDAHLGRDLYVGFGEHLALLDGELAYLQVFRAHAADARGVVVVAGDELSAAADVGADGGQEVGLVAQRFIVGQLERLHLAGVHAYAAPALAAGVYHDDVRAHLRNLGLDALLRALADGQHGDDRGHADDDAQHREEGAQFVVGQGAQGYLE